MNTVKTIIIILVVVFLLYRMGPAIVNAIARAAMKPGWRCYVWEWKSKEDFVPEKQHGRILSIDGARGLVSVVLDDGIQISVEKDRVFFI